MTFTFTPGDVSASQTLTDGDHLYPGHINELRVAANELSAGRILNVKDFGALGDDSTDDTQAFADALASTEGTYIFVPEGIYRVTGMTISQNYAKLVGTGVGSTVIKSTTANTPVISVNTSLTHIEISGMTIGRTATATSGGTGIDFSATTAISLLRDLLVEDQYNGIKLGSTDFSSLENIIVRKCLGSGIGLTNSPLLGTLQWSMNNVLSGQNVGYGIAVITAAGPSSCSLGTWRFVNTFANSSVGIYLNGANCSIEGLRLYDSFIGADNSSEIYMNTYGATHAIRNCYIELAGMVASGPTLSTPATGVGNGINITANNDNVEISGCHIHNCANSGISTSVQTTVNGCYISNNGLSYTGGERSGITLAAGSLLATGNRVTNDSGTAQLYGIYLGVDAGVVTGNYLVGNVTSGLDGAGTASVNSGNKLT